MSQGAITMLIKFDTCGKRYETEDHPGIAVTVKEEQAACRMFRGRDDD